MSLWGALPKSPCTTSSLRAHTHLYSWSMARPMATKEVVMSTVAIHMPPGVCGGVGGGGGGWSTGAGYMLVGWLAAGEQRGGGGMRLQTAQQPSACGPTPTCSTNANCQAMEASQLTTQLLLVALTKRACSWFQVGAGGWG